MRASLFASWLLLIAAGSAFADSPAADAALANDAYLQALDSCIEGQFGGEQATPSLNAELSLEEECPALQELLAEQNAVHSVPPLGDETSLNRLLDERHLLQARLAEQSPPGLDHASITTMASSYAFNNPVADELDWWTRFKNWLKENYGSEEEDSNLGWLIELLDSFTLPDWLGTTIFYTSIALIILLAVFILYNELRHVRRFRHRDQQPGEVDELAEIARLRSLDWDEVRALPAHQQVGAALQYLIQQFINRDLVTDNRSHTNREFYRELRRAEPGMAEQFNRVINTAEKHVYGKHELDRSEIEAALGIADSLAHADRAGTS